MSSRPRLATGRKELSPATGPEMPAGRWPAGPRLRRGPGRCLGLLLTLLLGVTRAADGAVELPMPDLTITVAPVALGVTRPPLDVPPAPPLAAPVIEAGAASAPRFFTRADLPLPVVRDPGGFSCAFVAFRRAVSLAECGVHRIYQGEIRGARDVLEESIAVDPRGAQAPGAHVWLGEVALREGRWEEAERRYRAGRALAPPAELAPHAELGLGYLALRRGDLGEAQRALGQALAYTPPQPVALVARYLYGIALLLAGRPGDALAQWDAVAQSGAPAVMAEELGFWRGAAWAQAGDGGRALDLLERFLRGVPGNHPLRADAHVQMGWIWLDRQSPAEAERRFLEAERAGPRAEARAQLLAGLVRAYLATGDGGRALQTGRRLAIEAPRDPLVAPTLLSLADLQVERGARREALDTYRGLLQSPLPSPVRDYVTYRLGENLEAEGRLADALAQYRALRDAGRDEAIAQRAVYRLGAAALRANDYTGARREAEGLLRAGAVADLREPTLLLAAEGAARANDANRAVTLFRTVLREFPASPRVAPIRLALGWGLLADGEPPTALREWQDVMGGGDLETATRAALAIADVALAQGDESQALAALRLLRSARLDRPMADAVALGHGVLAVRAGADAEAIQVLEPLTTRPGDFTRLAVIRRALGLARYRLRQYDQAEREFRQAVSHAAGDGQNWLGLGMAALQQGRAADAENALSRIAVGTPPEVGATATYGLLLAARTRNEHDLARQRSVTFVDRYPGHRLAPAVLHSLVVAALAAGSAEQAQVWAARLQRDAPQSEHVNQALWALATGAEVRPAIARQAYRDLLDRRPPVEVRAEAWLGLAETAFRLGDPADARRAAEGFLQEVPGADPRSARVQAMLIRAHEALGQRTDGIRAADSFLARFGGDPQAAAIQLARGRLLFEERQLEAAERALDVARDQGEPVVAAPAQFWLGEVRRARGDDDSAVAAYLGATYLYPDSPWAARGLQGAAQSYVNRKMLREAGIVLRKLIQSPGADPSLLQWARQALAQLGPAAAADPSPRLTRGARP